MAIGVRYSTPDSFEITPTGVPGAGYRLFFYLTNTLTPFVGDANTQTPEFKSFLVNIEKA